MTKRMLIDDTHPEETRVVIVNGNKDDVANRYTLENMRADKRDTDNDKADEYPTGLNARVPMLRINALSKQILTCDDTFQFEVEYQYDEPNSYYLATVSYTHLTLPTT